MTLDCYYYSRYSMSLLFLPFQLGYTAQLQGKKLDRKVTKSKKKGFGGEEEEEEEELGQYSEENITCTYVLGSVW